MTPSDSSTFLEMTRGRLWDCFQVPGRAPGTLLTESTLTVTT